MSALRIIREADQRAGAGLFLDAWEVLDTLPPRCRQLPAALRVRLMICTGLSRWRVGAGIAAKIAPDEAQAVREAAGRFYLAHAQAMMADQHLSGAEEAVRAFRAVWPEGEPVLQQTPGLPEVP
jgi:hypothetical protein